MQLSLRQSWGVASARQTSACIVCPSQQHLLSAERVFDVPIGPSVVRWCARTGRRVLQFQAHSDLITCMRMSPDKQHIVTTSYSGELKLWSGEGWKYEWGTQAPMAQQHHVFNISPILRDVGDGGAGVCKLTWRLDSRGFVIVGNGFESSIAMYSLTKSATVGSQLLWQVKAESFNSKPEKTAGKVEYGGSGQIPNTGRDYHYSDAFTMAEINLSSNIFVVKEKQNRSVSINLFSNEGELLKEVDINENSVPLLSTFNESVNGYGMVVQGGNVLVIDGENLRIKTKFHAGYTSRSCVWDGEQLVLPSDSGKLVWWSTSGERLFEAAVDIPGYVVHMQWSLSGRAVWMCGFSRLSYVEIDRNSDGSVRKLNTLSSISCHDIACCGVAFSDGGEGLCAGDLAGGVWAMEGNTAYSIHKTSVMASVRCLQWWGDSYVLIGCLDGRVCKWKLGDEETEEVSHLDGSVIIMRWNHERTLLAVGSSTGTLTVYRATDTSCRLAVATSFTAHPPQENNEDMRFGQLNKQAEIWSLCWSPAGQHIATCSEDQTAKIWDITNWSCQATLYGHTMAVTGVDWKQDSYCGSILATCSDDRTVRVMDGDCFKLIRILSTKDIYGWHTLTYLTLHPECVPSSSSTPPSRTLLLTCTTQHGYVVVWEVGSGKRAMCRRMHCGSIEGLASNSSSGTIATVGADCVVHLFNLEY